MSRLTATNDQLQLTQDVAATVKTLQEVSVLRMQKVRDSVLETRGYLDGLLDIYTSIRNLHQRDIEKILNKKSWLPWRTQTETPKRNGQTMLVLLSPSQRLSGELIHRVFTEFAEAVHQAPAETQLAIVGGVGRDLFWQQFGRNAQFTYLDWNENQPDFSALATFLADLGKYEQVVVFTAEFQSLVQQTTRKLNLSGNQELAQTKTAATTGPVPKISFLCEPSLNELVTFFEHQVVASLFKQSLDEAKLAHLGSRITALEQANQTITLETQKLKRHSRHLHRQQQQSKQLQRLSGMGVWYRA